MCDYINLSIVNAKLCETILFMTNTIGDAQGPFYGEIIPLVSMSYNKACTVFRCGNGTLLTCCWLGAAPSVSM